jgi:hemerythrin superfamily protein
VYYEELAPGIIIVNFQKYNKNEEPYLQPFYKTLYENENIKNALRAIAAVSRCAANGDTLKQSSKSSYAWKQVRTISG